MCICVVYVCEDVHVYVMCMYTYVFIALYTDVSTCMHKASMYEDLRFLFAGVLSS